MLAVTGEFLEDSQTPSSVWRGTLLEQNRSLMSSVTSFDFDFAVGKMRRYYE